MATSVIQALDDDRFQDTAQEVIINTEKIRVYIATPAPDRLIEQLRRLSEYAHAIRQYIEFKIVEVFETLYWLIHPVKITTNTGLQYDIRSVLMVDGQLPLRYPIAEGIMPIIRRQLLPREHSRESDHNDLALQ